MYENCPAQMRMVRMFWDGGLHDGAAYTCKTIRYQTEENCIYLLTGKTELTLFSLDALYECIIHTPEGTLTCQGVITQRYWNRHGRVIVFRIIKGFYKNLVN